MILVDPRDGATTEDISGEMVSKIIRYGVQAEKCRLKFGDFAFDGNGPRGEIMVGVERKTLHDMLHCIDDSRYNMQRIGMAQMYSKSFLIVEGAFGHNSDGILMERSPKGNWYYCNYRSKPVLYSKLYNYLISVAHSGVIITYSHDLWQTCFNVVQIFHYHQKKWANHTSLLEKQMLNIPSFNRKPSLVRRWAAEIEGIGVKFGGEAERIFRTPVRLANSDEQDWLRIEGIGVPTAMKIIREIGGHSE